MKIIICIISALFGGMSLAAAVTQTKSEKSPSAAIMIIGSLLLIFAVILNIIGLKFDFIIAALGCLAICAAAVMNGKKARSSTYPTTSFAACCRSRWSPGTR